MLPDPVRIFQLFNILGAIKPKLPREVVILIFQWYLKIRLPHLLVFGGQARECYVQGPDSHWLSLKLPKETHEIEMEVASRGAAGDGKIMLVSRAGRGRLDTWLWRPGEKKAEQIENPTEVQDLWLVPTPSRDVYCVIYNDGLFNVMKFDGNRDWVFAGISPSARYGITPVALADGRILICGGYDSSRNVSSACTLFDPATGLWKKAARMSAARPHCAAVLLPGGRVLVTGGGKTSLESWEITVMRSCEIYNPVSDKWTSIQPMDTPRRDHALVALARSNRIEIMAIGGFGQYGARITSTEILDLALGVWFDARSVLPTNIIGGSGRLTAIRANLSLQDVEQWKQMKD